MKNPGRAGRADRAGWDAPAPLGYFTRPKVCQILHVRSESESVGFTELNDIYFFQKKLILDMSDRVLRFNISR